MAWKEGDQPLPRAMALRIRCAPRVHATSTIKKTKTALD